MKIAAIVEGHGEVASLPILLRRIAQWRTPARYSEVLRPILVKRNQFLTATCSWLPARREMRDAYSSCWTQTMTALPNSAPPSCIGRRTIFRTGMSPSCWPTGNTKPGSSPPPHPSMAKGDLRCGHPTMMPTPSRRAVPKTGWEAECPGDTVKQPSSLHSLHVSICSWPTTAAARSANCAASGTGWDTDVPPGNPVIHETRPGTAGHDTPPAPPTDM